jgi:hypothetical protein
VYGPQPCPLPLFEAPPLWLYWGDFVRSFSGFFPTKGLRSSFPSSLVVHSVRIDAGYELQVGALVVIVTGSWSFV